MFKKLVHLSVVSLFALLAANSSFAYQNFDQKLYSTGTRVLVKGWTKTSAYTVVSYNEHDKEYVLESGFGDILTRKAKKIALLDTKTKHGFETGDKVFVAKAGKVLRIAAYNPVTEKYYFVVTRGIFGVYKQQRYKAEELSHTTASPDAFWKSLYHKY